MQFLDVHDSPDVDDNPDVHVAFTYVPETVHAWWRRFSGWETVLVCIACGVHPLGEMLCCGR
eukprot:134205-Chlamydomonas_euryale.AAC.1